MTARFLVTGGAGFIGSHLVRRLVSDGNEVAVLDDFSSGELRNLAGVERRIRLTRGSVTESSACREALHGVSFVLHHAALVSVADSMSRPGDAHRVNATGTLTLLEEAARAGVRRVVYAGTSAYYGNDPVLPRAETMPAAPLSPYGVSKTAGELYCHMFSRTFGLDCVTLRYFNVFGERQSADSPYSAVIPRFIDSALKNSRPTIFGDGEQTRDFVHVDNVVAANLLACRSGVASGRTYNIGSGAGTSLNTLWRRIAALAGADAEPIYRPSREGDVRDSVCSLDRARADLEYELTVSFEEGLRRTLESARADSAEEVAV